MAGDKKCSSKDFIEEVQNYPCLYDEDCKDFKNKYVKLIHSCRAVGGERPPS